MSAWMDGTECCRAALWVAGLWALAVGSVLLAVLPRDRGGAAAGLAAGAALGMFAAAAWLLAGMCGAG